MKMICYFCASILCCSPSSVQAEEQEYPCRVLGLFQKDREDDLRLVAGLIPGVSVTQVDYLTGQATFKLDAAKVFPGNNPQQIVQLLDQQFRNNSRSTFQVTPPTGINRGKLTKIELEILGLDCKGCSFAAYLAVYELPGVENATASFHDGKVTAWVEADKITREMLEEALERKGVKLKPAEEKPSE